MSTQPSRLELPAQADMIAVDTESGTRPAPPAKRYDFSRKYWLFALPAVVVILAVIIFPWVFTLYMSTQDWKIGGGAAFIALSSAVPRPPSSPPTTRSISRSPWSSASKARTSTSARSSSMSPAARSSPPSA